MTTTSYDTLFDEFQSLYDLVMSGAAPVIVSATKPVNAPPTAPAFKGLPPLTDWTFARATIFRNWAGKQDRPKATTRTQFGFTAEVWTVPVDEIYTSDGMWQVKANAELRRAKDFLKKVKTRPMSSDDQEWLETIATKAMNTDSSDLFGVVMTRGGGGGTTFQDNQLIQVSWVEGGKCIVIIHDRLLPQPLVIKDWTAAVVGPRSKSKALYMAEVDRVGYRTHFTNTDDAEGDDE